MKILILMSYFNRPLLVRNALRSILAADAHHPDWELVFGDDGSDAPGRPIVEEVLAGQLHKVTFVETGMSLDDKLAAGLRLGWFANRELARSDAAAAVMLCDDDELDHHYLKNLSEYFVKNPDVLYCWSYAILFNPLMGSADAARASADALQNRYNQHGDAINPVSRVDASQVAWRLDCCKHRGAWFADSTKFVDGKPWTKDTDKSFFESLYEKCGPCRRTGFVGQYKGVHDYQLLWHKNVGEDGLRAYTQMIQDNAGVKF
jgi:glycosyltransferase involved in cell wall biosynthesis